MTKTDPRLVLVERQRRHEWELARQAQTRAAGALVAGRTHDLLNFIQVVQLTVQELARRHPHLDGDELLTDLVSSSTNAHRQLAAMMAVARPEEVIAAGAEIGPAILGAVEAVRDAGVQVELTLTAPPTLTTRCLSDELTHLVFGLALAATAAGARGGDAPAIELLVRERAIEGAAWVELLCGTPAPVEDDAFDLRAVEAIVARRGGELSRSERREGGCELIVALPVVAARA